MRPAAICCLAALALAGCFDERLRDVQHYLDNPDERIAKMKECRNDPGTLRFDRNCTNASEAEQRAMFRGDRVPTL